MARLSFTKRLLGIVLLIQVCSLGVVLVLGLSKFEKGFERVSQERVRFILREVCQEVERLIQLGLPLGAARGLQPMIEREGERHDGIVAIHIHDHAGTILFSTDPTLQRRALPPEWRAASKGERAWALPGAGVLAAGMPVFGGIQQYAGGVVLVHSTSQADRVERNILWNSLILTAGFLAGFGLLALVLLRLLTSRLLRPFHAIEHDLNGDGSGSIPLPADYREFAAAYAGAERELDDLAKRLDFNEDK